MSPVSPEALTPREKLVLDLLRQGRSNKHIARELAISEQTVKYHLKNLYGKLGASGRMQAVMLAGGTPPAVQVEAPAAPQEAPGGLLSPLQLGRRTRKYHAQREAVVDQHRRLSYGEFFHRCDRASAAYQALGIRAGERVVTLAPNTLAHLEQFTAVPQIGAVLVPLNTRLTPDDYAALIRHSGARMVCAAPEFVPCLDGLRAQLPAGLRYVLLEGESPGWLSYETLLAQGDGRYEAPPIDEHALIAINYTSGTAGQPRGVMLTHRNIWLAVVGQLLHWPLQPSDRYLWLLPLFHGNGWAFAWTVTAAAATHVCVRSADHGELAHLMQRERVTALCAGKSALIAMARLPAELRAVLPSPVRLLTAGASPAAATIEQVERDLGWEVTHAYGLTETSPFVAVCIVPPALGEAPAAARARFKAPQGVELLTSGELRVVDEEGEDVPADGHSLGEVVVRGGVVMAGYLDDPEATAWAFRGGWFHTGDAAVMHADGYIEIRDRYKDIIISGDQIVSSLEVEDALMRHPAVHEVAVVGRPDAELGEAVHAYVVLRPGPPPPLAELLAPAHAVLAHFKRPHAVHRVEALPKTGTGKVVKQRLRQDDAPQA